MIMGQYKILLIENEQKKFNNFSYLGKKGWGIYPISQNEWKDEIQKRHFDTIVLGPYLPSKEKLSIIKYLNEMPASIPVIVIGKENEIGMDTHYIEEGVFEYIPFPFLSNRLLWTIEKAAKMRSFRGELTKLKLLVRGNYNFVIGFSEAMQRILSLIDSAVEIPDLTVLVIGETGVGKEVIANIIHERTGKGIFEAIDCAAIPQTLLEAELFGFEKGAFTGAVKSKPGRFELCKGGTIFLDEIESFPLEMQVNLLRVLETRKFRRLGGVVDIKFDGRIIAASNTPLGYLIKEGKFREDLYYRLNIFPITVPSLRERKEDILLLAYTFIDEFNKNIHTRVKGISKEAEEILLSYHWPGNIRELRNIIERGVILARGSIIKPEHLGIVKDAYLKTLPLEIKQKGRSLKDIVKDIEKRLIIDALKECKWNKSKAARLLKIPRHILKYKIKKYNIG